MWNKRDSRIAGTWFEDSLIEQLKNSDDKFDTDVIDHFWVLRFSKILQGQWWMWMQVMNDYYQLLSWNLLS